jgi:hypothetical protein
VCECLRVGVTPRRRTGVRGVGACAKTTFDGARVVDVAGDAKQLGALIVGATKAGEPCCTAPQNGGCNGNSFYVSDSGGAAIQPHVGGEGRLQTRFSRLAFQTLRCVFNTKKTHNSTRTNLDETCLLTADVSTSATVNIQIIVISTAASILTKVPLCVRLLYGKFYLIVLGPEFPTNVNVPSLCTHCEPGDQATFDQLVWFMAHDLAVLAGARLTIVFMWGVRSDIFV